jgi:hypothetical protein
MRRAAPFVLTLLLTACTPAEVLKAGAKLLAVGRTVDACEVYVRGQERFPRNADIALAKDDTCPAALDRLAATSAKAIGRGDFPTARAQVDRASSLLPLHPTTTAMQRDLRAGWIGAARAAYDAGDEATALRLTSALLSWDGSATNWRGELLAAAASRAVADGQRQDWNAAHARLDRFAVLGDPTGILAGARDQLQRMEAGVLRHRAEQLAADADLAGAWLLGRAASARDASHTGWLRQVEADWHAQHALGVAVQASPQDFRARHVSQAVADRGAPTLTRWTSPASADVVLTVDHVAETCVDDVTHVTTMHPYIAGTRQLPNPTWVALDREATSLAHQRDSALRDLHAAEGALGPSHSAVADAEVRHARAESDRAHAQLVRDTRADARDAAKQVRDAAVAEVTRLREQNQAVDSHGTNVEEARATVAAAEDAVEARKQDAARARQGRSPAQAARDCEAPQSSDAVAACDRWTAARDAVATAKADLEGSQAQLERLRETRPERPDRRDVAAADRARDQAQQALAVAAAELQAATDAHEDLVRAARRAARDLGVARDAAAAAERAVRTADTSAGRLDARLRDALRRRDAVPAELTEEIHAQHPYVVEQWSRTCTAAVYGSLEVDGRRQPVERHATLTLTDEAWSPAPQVGLRGNARAFSLNPGEVSTRLDGALRDELAADLDAQLGRTLAARASVRPDAAPAARADAMLVGLFAGIRSDAEVRDFARDALGATW